MTAPHPPDTIPRLLKYNEVAEALGVTERTVRTLCRAGELPFVRVGKQSVRFSPADLSDYIDRQRQDREVSR